MNGDIILTVCQLVFEAAAVTLILCIFFEN